MNIAQTARLLAKASLIDNRTVDELTIQAWHEVVGDLDFDDAMAALAEHRRASNDWVQPYHVIAGVRAIRRVRLERGTNAEGIPDADPDNPIAYIGALRENRLRVASGEQIRPVAALVAQAANTTKGA